MKKRNIAEELLEGVKDMLLHIEQSEKMEEELKLKKKEARKNQRMSGKWKIG